MKNKNYLKTLAVLPFVFFGVMLFVPMGVDAQIATQCIQVGKTSPEYWPISHTLRNNCGHRVEVVWCHAPSQHPGTASSVCGINATYYQQSGWLEPGQTETNQFSMPSDVLILYAACVDISYHHGGGGFNRFPGWNHASNNGTFRCNPQ